jgi:hypothetical protein
MLMKYRRGRRMMEYRAMMMGKGRKDHRQPEAGVTRWLAEN